MIRNSVNLADIDAIIFDLGGVIINIRYETTIEIFSKLAEFDVSRLYTQRNQIELFDRYEMGQLSTSEFRNGLRKLLNHSDISDNPLDSARNAMLLDIPKVRVEWLKQTGKQKRFFLLSNTNEIHKVAFDVIFHDTFSPSIRQLDELFEKAYFSHLMGDRKPNPSIFETVIAQQSLDASRTLFIDDSIQHIEGARSVGLQTFHMGSGLALETIQWAL